MSRKLSICKEGKPIYSIHMEQDFGGFPSVIKEMEADKRKVCLVFDSNVANFHKDTLLSELAPLTKELFSFTFPAGEANKNLDTVNDLYEFLIIRKFDRNDILAAVGGGVTGDLTGFAAATYLRGIRFIQIPTTLLAMSDSSIGGKTGVDFRSYKNMVGAFHQPTAVYMNFPLLATLPEREYLSGMGEIIKHSYIRRPDMIPLLKKYAEAVCRKDFTLLEEIVYQSCQVKQEVVERDPKEAGERAILNFGHTVGHSIEKLAGFTLLHGECVALGMLAAARISCDRGLISEDVLVEMKELLASYRLPVTVDGLQADEILRTTKLDKKMDAGQIKFILLADRGHAVIDRTVTDAEILSGIREVLR